MEEPVRSAEIVLNGTLYTVPAFNLRQLREVAALAIASQADPAASAGMPFDVLAIAMRRATPAFDGDVLDAELGENENLQDMFTKVLTLAGMVKAGEAEPGTETAAA